VHETSFVLLLLLPRPRHHYDTPFSRHASLLSSFSKICCCFLGVEMTFITRAAPPPCVPRACQRTCATPPLCLGMPRSSPRPQHAPPLVLITRRPSSDSRSRNPPLVPLSLTYSRSPHCCPCLRPAGDRLASQAGLRPCRCSTATCGPE